MKVYWSWPVYTEVDMQDGEISVHCHQFIIYNVKLIIMLSLCKLNQFELFRIIMKPFLY